MTQAILVRRVAARPAIVFDALVTAEGIAAWWGPDDLPVVSAIAEPWVNGRFRVRFRRFDGSEHECSGEFLEIARPNRVVMSWQWDEGGDAVEAGNASRLEFILRAIDTGTELMLIHSALRTEATARSHADGWAGALEKLLRRYPEARSAPGV
jgi:uncharacterized protein YndB with AHSA1/START domain